jgi:hypothetical protein
MIEQMDALAREPSEDLAALLAPCCEDVVLEQTKTRCRVHLLGRDANAAYRVDALTGLLARQVVDFCVPCSRVQEARGHVERTGSAEEWMRLRDEAEKLFTSLERSGEAGELLLYMLLERMLGLPSCFAR